ncbi:hypothetical protein BUALT_Bualt04G0003600 [Buddleja alternifolia]|uniref:Uncharacterized protein n=1 Tax=Buddleja alternifolia TaxID=168488 RepID=A0AAV6XM19_9LAMI|nr:hypothetical protein BUALT_Bualt04G0003600 [Buddleja alternifolia]
MPTFTAIAFDRLIEPGAAKSMTQVINSPDPKLERTRSSPSSRRDRGIDAPSSKMERGVSVPPKPKLENRVGIPPNPKLARGDSVPQNPKLATGVSVPSYPKLDRRNSASVTTTSTMDKKNHWTQISPALYATPKSTPLPDSPSSFPPSPYIINHKRRGPRLMKSFSEDDVSTCKQASDEIKVDENVSEDDISVPVEVLGSTMDDNDKLLGLGDVKEKHLDGVLDVEVGTSVMENGAMKSVAFNLQQDSEVDDFVDPQDSMSVKSFGESEGNGGTERSLNSTTPVAEFFDAWEELSSEIGPQLPMPDIENELREIRLSLLMEIEKSKQAEENLNIMQNQWQRIREQLSVVGLTLPEDPTTLPDGADPAAEVCQQVYLARFISNSIGRGIAKAEVEMEMEAQLKLKNCEIARLWDRLRYYEAVNQEMSQRNQEVVETTRRLRQRRKRRQRWVWGSIATAITLGSTVLAYSYFHTGKGSSSLGPSPAPEVDGKRN